MMEVEPIKILKDWKTAPYQSLKMKLNSGTTYNADFKGPSPVSHMKNIDDRFFTTTKIPKYQFSYQTSYNVRPFVFGL